MQLDKFTQAYIRTALWSSTGPKFGACPCCGRMAILDHLPEPEFDQEEMCGADGCGVRELNNLPPLDDNYSANDLAPETLARIVADCERFQRENAATLESAIAAGVKCSPDFDEIELAGHDFWLTRNGHGAGFWDGEWPEPQEAALTHAAEVFGNLYLYPGDDGKLYF